MIYKYSIGSVSLKCWGRVIHTLATTTENDIHFVISANSLTLTTFDSALSVCGVCKFDKAFFQSYEVEEVDLCCRIPSKCLLKPFKSLRFLLKSAEACEMDFQSEVNNVVISIPCKGGMRLQYTLNFTHEADAPEVEYDSTSLENCIAVAPSFMLKSLSNFASTRGVTDLTLTVTAAKLLLKNCCNDMLKREAKVYTEVTLNAVDFSEYRIAKETEITIPMREFKTFVSFTDQMKATVSLHFSGPNDPLLVKSNTENDLYAASLMMASKPALSEERTRHQRKTKKSTTYVHRRTTTSDPLFNISLPRTTKPTSTTNINHTNVHPSFIPNHPDDNQNEFDDLDAILGSCDIPSFDAPPPPPMLPPPSPPMLPPPPPSLPDLPTPSSAIHSKAVDYGSQRVRRIFPNIARQFDPVVDLPGFNNVLVECSDDES